MTTLKGADRSPAFAVLTHYELLHHIASFQNGLPYLLGQFEAELLTPEGTKLANYRGKLPQFAIRRRDKQLLELLLKATQDPRLRVLPQLQFRGVRRTAIEYNSLSLLKWLHATRDTSPTLVDETRLLATAVTSYFDNDEILDWLHSAPEGPREKVYTVSELDVCRAASLGNVKTIRWLHEHGCTSFSRLVMDTAATHGHLNIVQYLHENRTEGCTTRAMHGAALNGYDVVVAFLAQNRSEGPNMRTLEMAAGAGQLRCVQVLCRLAKPPPRGTGAWRLAEACRRAVDEGRHDVARFLRQEFEANAGLEKGSRTRRCFCFWVL